MPRHPDVSAQDQFPLNYEVNVAVLPARGMRVVLEADAAEKLIIAREADAVSVDRFSCELLFKRWHRNGVSVTGEVFADIIQQCVITLEPVRSEVREPVDRTFIPDGSKLTRPHLNRDGEMVLDYEGRDEPEAYSGDTLNAWKIALEHFLLGVEPFPRKDGAALPEGENTGETDGSGQTERPGPFAGLKDLLEPKD